LEKGESTKEKLNHTVTEIGLLAQAMDYLNVDFKFLTIVILLISIGAVVVIFPRVSVYYTVNIVIFHLKVIIHIFMPPQSGSI
jgi:hypothetical protein